MSARHLFRAALACGLLTLSPVGAPAVGIAISKFCPHPARDGGASVEPYGECGVAPVVEHLYQDMILLPFQTLLALPSILGAPLFIVWAAAIVVLPILTLVYGALWLAALRPMRRRISDQSAGHG